MLGDWVFVRSGAPRARSVVDPFAAWPARAISAFLWATCVGNGGTGTSGIGGGGGCDTSPLGSRREPAPP